VCSARTALAHYRSRPAAYFGVGRFDHEGTLAEIILDRLCGPLGDCPRPASVVHARSYQRLCATCSLGLEVLTVPELARLLGIACRLAPVLALWPRLPRTMSLTIARSAMLDDCVTTRVAWTGALHLTRDGARVIACASGDWLIGELVEHFAALPADLQRIEIEGAGDHAPALIEAAHRRHIELILLPLGRRTGYIAGFDR